MSLQLRLEGDQSLAYTKVGSGPAVVLVHGIGGHKEDWAATAQALAGSYTVYAVDMLGFGGSSKTAAEITIATQVDAILALLTAEGVDRADLLGNSVGGWVTAMIAAQHPQRVRKLVLVDPAGFKAMFEGESPVNFYPQTAADMQHLLSYVRYQESARSAHVAQQALAALEASGDGVAGERVFNGLFVSPRLEELLPKIDSPTLVVWGAEDKLFPSGLADMVAGGIRGAEKVLIPQASHFPQLDNPDAFHQVVASFLNR